MSIFQSERIYFLLDISTSTFETMTVVGLLHGGSVIGIAATQILKMTKVRLSILNFRSHIN